jgi:hypothetical protein
MLRRLLFVMTLIVSASALVTAQTPAPPAAPAADVTGTWNASFDTMVGVQEYTYTFAVKGGVLTGKAKSSLGGEADLREGKVDGRTVAFKETITVMEMQIEITYAGEIVSADEIRFTRTVGEFATEQLVAKRAK